MVSVVASFSYCFNVGDVVAVVIVNNLCWGILTAQTKSII